MAFFFLHNYMGTIGLPLAYVDRTDSGSILSRFHNIMEIQNQGVNMMLAVVLDSIMAVVGAIVLCSISYVLFSMVIVMLIIYAILTILFISPIGTANRDVQKKHSDLLTIINEVLSGMGTIKLQQGEDRFLRNFAEVTHDLSRGLFKILNLKNILSSLIIVIESVASLFIIWLGSKLVVAKAISLGDLVAFEALTAYFVMPIKNIISTFSEFQNTVISVERVGDILSIEREPSSSETMIFDEGIKTIELKNVTYRYNLVNKSLDDVNLMLNAGSITGIVGSNGSGKTTLLKMIGTLISPEEGDVLFENVKSTRDLLPSIRNKLAYVSQDPYVFEGTLRENLTLGNTAISDDLIDEICRKFGLFELTAEGNGLGLFLLENGDNLSGGQKQRIGLARALLSNPEVLLLDEATSGLDSQMEERVFKYLYSLKKKMIIISIFHGVSFSRYVNRVLVMEKGKIVYDGPPET